MKALARFYTRGVEDADRRVAAALGPVETDAADRYLQASRVVTVLDGVTRQLQDWWLQSAAGRALSEGYRTLTAAPTGVRYQTIASVLLIAVISHVGLMLMQGPRPGWFWMVIPAMVALFAALLLAGSQSPQSGAPATRTLRRGVGTGAPATRTLRRGVGSAD